MVSIPYVNFEKIKVCLGWFRNMKRQDQASGVFISASHNFRVAAFLHSRKCSFHPRILNPKCIGGAEEKCDC